MAIPWEKVPLKLSVHNKVLHQDFDKKICEIKNKYPGMPTRTISCHASTHIREEFADPMKYFSLSTLQKGIMTEKYKKRRLKFCKIYGVTELWL